MLLVLLPLLTPTSLLCNGVMSNHLLDNKKEELDHHGKIRQLRRY